MAIVGFIDLETQKQLHDESLWRVDLKAKLQREAEKKMEITRRKKAAQAYYRQRAARQLKVRLRELIKAR